MEKAEAYLRSKMGMPPPSRNKKSNSKRKTRPTARSHEPIIPKEYAEDVEFTETINYSQNDVRFDSKPTVETYHESQISDAEWTEIKSDRSK